MHPLQIRFGEVLRRRREALEISQETLAAWAGLHRNYVGLLERGRAVPSLLVIEKLATALGISMTEFIAEIERPPTSPPQVS